jgi:hypothetical protein
MASSWLKIVVTQRVHYPIPVEILLILLIPNITKGGDKKHHHTNNQPNVPNVAAGIFMFSYLLQCAANHQSRMAYSFMIGWTTTLRTVFLIVLSIVNVVATCVAFLAIHFHHFSVMDELIFFRSCHIMKRRWFAQVCIVDKPIQNDIVCRRLLNCVWRLAVALFELNRHHVWRLTRKARSMCFVVLPFSLEWQERCRIVY